MRFLSLLMMLAVLPAAADKLEESKTHFRAGEALYQVGQYRDAIREFSAGYELEPRPPFLLNMGQAYRKLNEPAKALELFEKYLQVTDAEDRRRPDVERMAAELREQMAHEPAPVVSAPPPAQMIVVATPPPKKSFARRHWWIFPVAAVIAGGAIGVGVYFGTRNVNRFDCGGAIACIDTTR